MKKLLKILFIVLVILAAGLYYLVNSMDLIIKKAIVVGGKKVIQTEVSLSNVDFELKQGKAELDKLVIGNPEGFKTESAVSLGKILAKVDTNTIFSDVVIVDKIDIEDPEITYEISSDKGSNINAINSNINKFISETGAAATAKASAEEAKTSTANPEKKIVIRELLIHGGKVNVSASILGGKQMSVSLPSIKLTNLGKNEKGLSGAEIGAKVMQAIIEATTNSVASANIVGLDNLKGQLGDIEKNVESTKDSLKDLLKK